MISAEVIVEWNRILCEAISESDDPEWCNFLMRLGVELCIMK